MVARDLAGERILVPISARVGNLESIFTLNDVAGRIWDLLEDPVDPESIVEALEREFEAERGVLERDVARLLESLVDARLVQVDPTPADP